MSRTLWEPSPSRHVPLIAEPLLLNGLTASPAAQGCGVARRRTLPHRGIMARAYWQCSCGTRNERIKQRCANQSCRKPRPKRRVPKHARTLRDDGYTAYTEAARAIHGVTDESCCVCGRPRHEAMRHHRDHDHVSGLPRGLACFQCNRLMPRLLTVERARLIVAYLERVEAFYASVEHG